MLEIDRNIIIANIETIPDGYIYEALEIKINSKSTNNLHIKGRIAANKCLEKLGIKDFKILNNKSGAPIWPEGVYGSISHSHQKAVAVASKEYKLVGIDLEHRKRTINLNLQKKICSKHEQNWIKNDNEKLLSIFSTKEAIYKALFPIKKLSWKDVELSRNENGFDIELKVELRNIKNFKTILEIKDDYITSLVYLNNKVSP